MFWILNITAVILLIAGSCFVDDFGMILMGLAIIPGIISSYIWRAYLTKRTWEEKEHKS